MGFIERLRSATLWTTGYDTKNLILQYHTQHNRRIRQVDFKKIDFDTSEKIAYVMLDEDKVQDIKDVTPSN